MRVVIFSFVFLALTGCVSHKLPMPKGKWVAVNEAGYIPPTVTRYMDNVQTLSQDIDIGKATEKSEQTQTQGEE